MKIFQDSLASIMGGRSFKADDLAILKQMARLADIAGKGPRNIDGPILKDLERFLGRSIEEAHKAIWGVDTLLIVVIGEGTIELISGTYEAMTGEGKWESLLNKKHSGASSNSPATD